MLMRYTMYRGKRPEGDSLPDGIRQDTRKHTRHFLRPPGELVVAYLKGDDSVPWEKFREQYLRCLYERFEEDAAPFQDLAALAGREDVFLGCSCPTKRNPDVNLCHTVLALEFMKGKFPGLPLRFPC
jgi:uncharacterized protein YeaO (DUF488 family)